MTDARGGAVDDGVATGRTGPKERRTDDNAVVTDAADDAVSAGRTGPLAGLIDRPAIRRFDEVVDAWADLARGVPILDRLFYALSTLGDHGIIWHIVGLSRIPIAGDTFYEAVELSSALGVEAAIVNGPVKMLFRRTRPTPVADSPYRLRTPRTSSFPSGHASAGAFAAALLADRSRRGWPWYLLGGLIGWSRVHVRIHHPSDVVGGYAVGWLLGRFALRALRRTA